MKFKLLEILACPNCYGDVHLHNQQVSGEDILSGELKCMQCDASYEIINGVPCMLPEAPTHLNTQQGFSEQWNLRINGCFNIENQYGVDYPKWVKYILKRCKIKMTKSDWMLDAGCGSGALTQAFRQVGTDAEVVALDFQNDIYKCAQMINEKHQRVHFVHGDVLRPPFKPEVFQLVVSNGVLHHTSNTKKAFDAISKLVKPSGNFSVWLYPDYSESGPMMKSLYLVRDWLLMKKGHKLSSKLRFRISQLLVAIKLPLYMLLGGMEYFRLRKLARAQQLSQNELWERIPVPLRYTFKEFFSAQVFVLYDNITPTFQTRHKRQEIEQWLTENAFTDINSEIFNPGQYMALKSPSNEL